MVSGHKAAGFTLLEVMVAVALLAMGIVLLLQVQARSIQLAQEARNISVATGLARAKLYDCQQELMRKGFSIGDFKEEGDFSDDKFPGFFWECHAYKPDLPVADATEITTGLTASAAAEGSDSRIPGAGDAAGIGAGMIAPILSQVSSVIGDSIRELIVIVRWQEGMYWNDLRVTTHVIDKTAINAIAGSLGAMGGGIPGMPGGGIPGMPGMGGGQQGGGMPGMGGGQRGGGMPGGGRRP
jgi:general secretion pathway protein I